MRPLGRPSDSCPYFPVIIWLMVELTCAHYLALTLKTLPYRAIAIHGRSGYNLTNQDEGKISRMGSVAGTELYWCTIDPEPRSPQFYGRLLWFISLLQEQLLTCLAQHLRGRIVP
jgi:hypothetical protein